MKQLSKDLQEFIKDIGTYRYTYDVWGYVRGTHELINSKYTMEEFVKYEKKLHKIFNKLWKALAPAFIAKYSFMMPLFVGTDAYHFENEDIKPEDILTISYFDFLHEIGDELCKKVIKEKKEYDGVNDIDEYKPYLHVIDDAATKQPDYQTKIKTWRSIKFDFDRMINLKEGRGKYVQRSYFTQMVIYIISKPKLYHKIIEQLKNNIYPLSETIYFWVSLYVDLNDPFPNISLEKPYPSKEEAIKTFKDNKCWPAMRRKDICDDMY